MKNTDREIQILASSRSYHELNPNHQLTYQQRQNFVKKLTLGVLPVYGALLDTFEDYNEFTK